VAVLTKAERFANRSTSAVRMLTRAGRNALCVNGPLICNLQDPQMWHTTCFPGIVMMRTLVPLLSTHPEKEEL
jgi:hypothetical protein